MSKHKKIISLMFVALFMISLVSSLELKVVNVENLKEGDVIIDKYGNEIIVTNITTKPSESLTISEYLRQKIDLDSLKIDDIAANEKFVADGNSGAGSITGNAIVSGTAEKQNLNNFQKIVNKIIVWFSR